MEHPPHRRKLPDDGKAVAVGLPVVENDRQLQLLRQRQLPLQHLLLQGTGRVLLPVVVQSDLPDGHHLLPLRQLPQTLYLLRLKVVAVLRVQAHCGVYMGKLRRQCNGLLRGGQGAAGVHHQPDTLLGQSRQYLPPVRVKGLIVIVGMGIKQHGCSPFAQSSTGRRSLRRPVGSYYASSSVTRPSRVSATYCSFSSRRRAMWGCCKWMR